LRGSLFALRGPWKEPLFEGNVGIRHGHNFRPRICGQSAGCGAGAQVLRFAQDDILTGAQVLRFAQDDILTGAQVLRFAQDFSY
jgi:hypothetical protein